MNFATLLGVEFKKIRRSKILLLMAAAVVILWLPSIFNARLSFDAVEGVSPEQNFFIQGFLGVSWFMYPGSMVVCTVLLIMTERNNGGLRKMLSLPIGVPSMCMAKFTVLLVLAAAQVLMSAAMYYVSAAVASQMQTYNFLLPPLFVLREAGLIFLSSVPMLAFFWMLAVCIRTPIFSIGVGLASIVPSVLMINTRFWFAYPVCYPFYIITSEYGRMSDALGISRVEPLPWLPVAAGITVLCLLAACLRFGAEEKK